MNDAAVMPRLMPGKAAFLLDQDKPRGRIAPQDFHRGRKADNATADDAMRICHADFPDKI